MTNRTISAGPVPLIRRVGRRWAARSLALGLVVGVSLFAASGASAATPPPGLWYYNLLNVAAAHSAGWTGKGVTIAVIDSPVNLSLPTLAGAQVVTHAVPACNTTSGTPIRYSAVTTALTAWHGSNVLSLIVGSGKGYSGSQAAPIGVAPDAKILYYTPAPTPAYVAGESAEASVALSQCYDSNGNELTGDNVAADIRDAVNSGAQIISVSLGGGDTTAGNAAIAFAEHMGVVIVAARPDELLESSGNWPASANGVVSVQAAGTAGAALTKDPGTDVSAPGIGILVQGNPATNSWSGTATTSGTSSATPIVAGFLALVKQKYPNATGNQLIQTLIRNTGTQSHALVYDSKTGLGYGTVSLTHMLSVDPTKYADTNPLQTAHPLTGPSIAQIASSGSSRSSSPSSPAAAGKEGSTSWLVPTIIGGVVGLLIIIGGIILLATRRARKTRTNTR
jgi:subtilisin family serine protease